MQQQEIDAIHRNFTFKSTLNELKKLQYMNIFQLIKNCKIVEKMGFFFKKPVA